MFKAIRIPVLFLLLAAFGAAHAAGKDIDHKAIAALNALYASTPAAKALGERAKAVIVFPEIYKAALLVGGQGGNGALFQGGNIVGHYNIAGLAVGLEGGAQTYSYALFLMSDEAVERLYSLEGFEVGVDPHVVVVNAAAGSNISTTTAQRDVYAYVYNAQGLMGGVSLQGLKITKLSK